MIYTVFLLIIGNLSFTLAILQCPSNTLQFDYEPCNVDIRSQCPSGFTCRRGIDSVALQPSTYLCCESAPMSASDWFVEAKISPQVFPLAPKSKLAEVELNPVDQNTAFPIVHIGDEVVVLTFPYYVTAMVQAINFTTTPLPGGYIHVMTICDALYKPFAIFFNYNIPNQGFSRVLTRQNDGFSQFTTYMDNSTFITKMISYRTQYVVLVFYTNNPLNLGGSSAGMMGQQGTQNIVSGSSFMGNCTDVACLMISPLGTQLGQPVAGSLFYLTTKNTMFPTSDGPTTGASKTVTKPFSSYLAFTVTIIGLLYIQ